VILSSPKLIKGWLLSRVPQRSAVSFHYWGRVFARRLEPEVDLVAKLVTPELTAVDIGANYGVYTAAMLKAGARVIAFEPLKECAEALRYYSSRNNGRLIVHETALSDHAGEAQLHLPRDQSRALTGLATLGTVSTTTVHEDRKVELRTLDSYELTSVRLIKIDVEGHEQSVIRGAERTIAANSLPSLLVEIEQERLDKPIAEVFELILNFGYEGWFLRDRRPVSIQEFRLERDQPPGRVGVHNFLFVNPGERWRLNL
jgi:FkbM family methyltransferase